MFRTRDFILIFTSVVFLLLAIGSTTLFQHFSGAESESAIKLVNNDDKEYGVVVEATETISREERLLDMKSKIAASGDTSLSAPEPEVLEPVEDEVDSDQAPVAVINLCSDYHSFTKVWPIAIKFEVAEGARIAFTESLVKKEIAPATATASAVVADEVVKDILLQLPIYPVISANSFCIKSDVIGVAQDGSLIRNNEVGLYSVFGDSTLIGYALDGFPIYGVSETVGDTCGGKMANGQYGYYLSKEREVVINCFKGTPTNL